MFNGVSAIEAHQEKMDVIGNNIANVSTTGYKAGRVTFEDQLSQTLQGASLGSGSTGGTNPLQLGLGVKVASIDTIMTQGGLQSTSRATDMAIQGNGFFMEGNASGISYTRDGSFALDNSGNLVNAADGSYVLGWAADASGVINNTTQVTPQSKIAIPVGGLTTVSPTSSASYSGNLSADALSTDPAFTRSIDVYDSLGKKQNLTLSFTRDAATNTWNWSASGDAGASGSGQITFDSAGKQTGATGTVTMSPTDGSAAPQIITPDFSHLTQLSGATSAAPLSQNGFGPGTLKTFSIDQTGAITGIFSNGLTRPLGQVALASFSNPEGLQRSGGNKYVQSINSGLAQVGAANTAGLGGISTGYLEQSNVDLSTEFTNMIITQRGFQANTKIITTVDQLLDDVIRLKQ